MTHDNGRRCPRGNPFRRRSAMAAMSVGLTVAAGHAAVAADYAGPMPPAVMTSAQPPAPGDEATVAHLVDQLTAADLAVQQSAIDQLINGSFVWLHLVEARAARPDLPAPTRAAVAKLLPDLRAVAKAGARRVDAEAADEPWLERMTLADYDAGGHTDPKWDDAAHAFLKLARRRYALWGPAAAADRTEAKRQLDLAVTAGCDDPVVLACGALLAADTGVAPADVADAFDQADAAATDQTPPYYRVVIDGRVARAHPGTMDVPRLSRMAANVQRVDHLPTVPPAVAAEVTGNLFETGRASRMQIGPICKLVIDPLADRFPTSVDVLSLQGDAYRAWAWEARGQGWASTVTPQGAKDFADRLDVAEAALTKAYQQDPTNPTPPTMMLQVELGQGKDRMVMERWYARAMAANPYDRDACLDKLYYLTPKWYGSADDVLQFGHQLLAADRWHRGLPLTLVDAHADLADAAADAAGGTATAAGVAAADAYFAQPAVWADVRAVYDGYLSRYPADAVIRSDYAKFAVRCQQYKAADEQLTRLGDRVVPSAFGTGNGDGWPTLAEARQRVDDALHPGGGR